MKMCFFINPSHPTQESLKAKLKEKGYMILQTQSPDEIDQAGQQCSQLILFFDDSKFAYKFLNENSWSKFRLLNILLLPKKPTLSLENKRMLFSVSLEVFGKEEEDQLFKRIKNFEDKKEEHIEIEFGVHEELKEKK